MSTPKKLTIGILGALVLVAAAWLLMESGESRVNDPRVDVRAPSTDATDAPVGLSGSPTPAAAPIAPRRFSESRATSAETEALLRVVVVEGTTGVPVGGAEVAAGEESSTNPSPGVMQNMGTGDPQPLPPFISDFDDAPERVVADAAGVAVIRSRPRLMVAARRGELFGSRRWSGAPTGEVRLPIGRSFPIAARVVTSTGDPVTGIPVVLRRVYDVPGELAFFEQVTVPSRAPDGLAIMRMWPEGIPPSGKKGDTLEAWLEGVELTKKKAPFHELRSGPLTLTLPPGGSVRVALVGPEGETFHEAARVYVGVARPAGDDRGDVIPVPSVHVDTNDGTALIRYAPVGVPLTVVGTSEGFEPVAQEIEPLGVESAIGSAAIRFARRRSTLVGRLVDETGAPLVSRAFTVETVTRGPPVPLRDYPSVVRSGPLHLVCDQDGMFRTVAPLRAELRRGGLTLEFEVQDRDGRVSHTGIATFPTLAEGDETSLGDVRVWPPAVIVAGKVVDDLGEPLPGAIVVAQPAEVDPHWPPFKIPPLRAKADQSGAFTMTCPPGAPAWRDKLRAVKLTGEAEGYAQLVPSLPGAVGRTGVVVVLSGAGVIEGRLKPSTEVALYKLDITVVGAGFEKPLHFSDCVNSDGSFRVRDVPPGSVTLVVNRVGTQNPLKDPLVRLEGIVVPRLGVARDPRLQGIELR